MTTNLVGLKTNPQIYYLTVLEVQESELGFAGLKLRCWLNRIPFGDSRREPRVLGLFLAFLGLFLAFLDLFQLLENTHLP